MGSRWRGPGSIRPKPIGEVTEDTLRMRTRESDPPPRLRKSAESEFPAPLRTRTGLEDGMPRIPKAAKTPALLPRVIMPARTGETLAGASGAATATPVSADDSSIADDSDTQIGASASEHPPEVLPKVPEEDTGR